MTKPQGFLATFRIDEELWGKFKDIAKNKQTSASALIIQYIQGVVCGDAIPQNIDNSPHSYIQDIDNRIDEKIRQSIQNINTPSIQNIEDLIDARIGGSVHAGHIKDAIAVATGQFNGLIDELQDLKSQLQELQSIPPAAAAVPEQLTSDNGQLTKDVESDRSDSDFNSVSELPVTADIENLLGIEDILSGSPYDLNYLNDHVRTQLNEHKSQIEAALKIKLNLSETKYICREFNRILRAMGLTIENKQIKKVETYWVVPK